MMAVVLMGISLSFAGNVGLPVRHWCKYAARSRWSSVAFSPDELHLGAQATHRSAGLALISRQYTTFPGPLAPRGGSDIAKEPPGRERWQQIETLLDAVLELTPAQRAAFLDDACAGDDRLRRDVERPLRAGDTAGLLEAPVQDYAAPIFESLASTSDPAAPGDRIGAYRIIQETGRGGMAVVYLVERDDGEYRRRAALKLVRVGLSVDYDLPGRFRHERQILASLEHPNIAHLLDGGVTAEGRPWFLMEYVDGRPIDRYCDENRLPVQTRLELFATVCDAVDHAHRKRIVHRDLKPANILVTDEALLRRSVDQLAGEALEDGGARLRLGVAHYMAGDWEEAEPLLRSVAAERPESIALRGLLGVLAARRGDTAGATEASAWLAALDRPRLRGSHTFWRARIASLLGERTQAVRLLDQAHREGAFIWRSIHMERDFEPLHDYPAFRDFVRPRG